MKANFYSSKIPVYAWYQDPDHPEFECLVCGKPMENQSGICSRSCLEADQM